MVRCVTGRWHTVQAIEGMRGSHGQRTERNGTERSLLRSKALLVFGVCAVVFAISAVAREHRRRAAVQEEIQSIAQEVSALELQRQRLTDLLERASTPEFLEREARLRLGLQLPGEQVVIVPPGSGTGSDAPTVTQSAEESNVRRWWRHIFE